MIPEKLFPLIRAGLDLEAEFPELSAEDCAELLSLGKRQSILPILYWGLKKLGAPEDMLEEWDRACVKDLYLFVQLNEAQKSVSSVLNGKEIPYIPLKGAVLRWLYPAPELRTSCDLDVLVREDELDRAVQALETGAGFNNLGRAYHDISMANKHVHLELHFSIKENIENVDALLCRAWDYAAPTGEGSRWTFTPEFQLFHVIAHMSYHFLHGGLGIRPFLDLWLLRHKTQYDEETVRQMCSSCGILTFYEQCCALSEVWLGGAAHMETTEMLESFCLSGGVFGSSRFESAGLQRKRRGWRYILSRIFPPPDQVREQYRDESGKKHTLLYYYVKRLISWLGRRRRKELKTQMRAVLSCDPEYLDSADELFRRLEL